MKKLSMILALVLLMALAASAIAQDEDEERDVLEASIFGGVIIPSGGLTEWQSISDKGVVDLATKTSVGFGADFGVFLTRPLVVGLNFTYTATSADGPEAPDDLKHRFYNPSLYLKYYFFGESNFVPYGKIHVGLDNPRFITKVYDREADKYLFREVSYDPVLAFGAGGGVFYYTSDWSGLFLEGNLHIGLSEETTGTFQDIDYTFGENTTYIDIHAGIKVFFGAGQ